MAKYYSGNFTPDHFFCANSGSACLEYIIRAFIAPEDECIISTPAFGVYKKFIKWSRGKVVDVPLLDPDYILDVDGILNAISDRTKLIFLTSPNNPTGTHICKADLDRLFAEIPDHVVVVLDEVYYHFADAPDYTTAVPYVQKGYNVIGVNSFSKTYGLAAMRIGYGYTTKRLSDYIHKICKPFLIDTLSLEAGIAALEDKAFVDEVVRTVKAGRKYLYQELDRLGIRYWKSQGNFILIKPSIPTGEFEDKMLEEGVMVRQVGNFGAPGCIRVTVGTSEANEAFISALEKVMN